MPLIEYVPKRFGAKALDTIENANKIIGEYQAQGYELTLRQLYYQFVSRNLIQNTMREYKNLGSVVNDARLAGLIDWDAIVDRTRNLQGNQHWSSPSEIVAACVRSYQIDKWANQPTRVEVWIEKDALVGVIERVSRQNDVSFFSCRGYTSQSELWSAAQRLRDYEIDGQDIVVLHLGDHDPSGKDMSRDIEDRLRLFGVESLDVRRIALNMDQVRLFNPPPNPAKITDSRASKYIRQYGTKSWELDALEPQVIVDLIQDQIDEIRDNTKWNEKVREEKADRKELEKAAKALE